MEIKHSLHREQKQSLKVTPVLRRAISLLQANTPELEALIREEFYNNPLLDLKEAEEPPLRSKLPLSFGGDEKGYDRSEGQAAFSSFYEKIARQIFLTFSDPQEKEAAFLLLSKADAKGRLKEDLSFLVQASGLTVRALETLRQKMMRFEPAGLFAPSLEACLSVQAEEKGVLDEPMRRLLQNLSLIPASDDAALAALCRTDRQGVQSRLKILQSLQPYPADGFAFEESESRIPDVYIFQNGKGKWCATLSSENLQKPALNRETYTALYQSLKSRAERLWLEGKLHEALWFLKTLQQRSQTLLRVSEAIAEREAGFFHFGAEFLSPLTLHEIATATGLHESTVSRICVGKYIETPRGIFKMKYFFRSSLQKTDGDVLSSEFIRSRILDLIKKEDALQVLSDEAVAAALLKEGIQISRRTVTKYREILRIPNSTDRRLLKKRQLSSIS